MRKYDWPYQLLTVLRWTKDARVIPFNVYVKLYSISFESKGNLPPSPFTCTSLTILSAYKSQIGSLIAKYCIYEKHKIINQNKTHRCLFPRSREVSLRNAGILVIFEQPISSRKIVAIRKKRKTEKKVKYDYYAKKRLYEWSATDFSV